MIIDDDLYSALKRFPNKSKTASTLSEKLNARGVMLTVNELLDAEITEQQAHWIWSSFEQADCEAHPNAPNVEEAIVSFVKKWRAPKC